MYSVLRLQPFTPILSAAYALIAKQFLPLGKFIFAASSINDFDDAQATSLEFVILKFHVRLVALGRLFGSSTSLSVRIITVLSLFLASANLLIWVGVNTSFSFCNSPLHTTMWLAGAVILTS